MKSAVFYGKHDLRIEDTPIPKVGAHDVLIKIKVCGVCGTDIHIFEGDEGAAPVTASTILGHEFSGIAAEVGELVTTCKPGDRVCADPNCYCGTCTPCRNGIAHYCENMIGFGTTENGGFAEYCVVPEQQIYQLGTNTSFEQGAMAEPVACCLHGIDLCRIQPGYKVIVIGGGMIGLLMVQLAKIAGAARVVLIEPVKSKRDVGKKLGADYCIDPTTEDPADRLREFDMADNHAVIECVGKPATIEQAIELAGNKAVIMMFGLTSPEETITVKPFRIFQKELELKSSYINPYTQKRALDLIDSGRLDVSSMVYDICGLERLSVILGSAEERRKGKFLIAPGE